MRQVGGFTITSTPADLQPSPAYPSGYLELAIQRSPRNPPAAWLWKAKDEIQNASLKVRVGGNFTWPPRQVQSNIDRVVFVAGGVGVKYVSSLPPEHSKMSISSESLY